ncbi:hypothetical protein ACFTZB_07575 [Rhodococcus sp. NPDC057014]|uniref:hypothetical protein n=1 Tax=unclassified Rhodococcus (in: high G+C Gram-positive bacteria) TaxID=192944 RepID=UPI00362ED7FF
MAQHNKGPRGQIATRAPLRHHEVYESRAAELGIPAGDYSVLILAITHGLDIPDYISEKLRPEQLRLLEVEAAGSLHRVEQLAMGA